MVRLEGVDTQVNFTGNLHPNIKVTDVSRPRDPQRWAFALDAPRPISGFSVHNNSINNLVRGLNERVFYINNSRQKPTAPNVVIENEVCVHNEFDKLRYFADMLPVHNVTPWTLEAFVKSYTGSQRTRYQRCADSLAVEPLSKRDQKVSTFVKCEKINFNVKQDPAPRVIQPRNPRFNTEIGVYIKPLEKVIYKRMKQLYKLPCVAKGFDAYQTGDIISKKWALFTDPCCIGLDASRFDQHCSKAALEWTHSIYLKYINEPKFASLLQCLLVNEGYGSAKDGAVKYWVEGCRMSGDMDTALGNCLLMVAMTYSLCTHLGIEHEVMDNGDDIIVIMDRKDNDKFREAVHEWYSLLGFTMKVEPTVHILEEIEFCQMHPVYDGSEWRMVRNLIALTKDTVCTTNQDQVAQWLNAIGRGGISLTAGIPVYQEFYEWLSKYGNTKRNKTSSWKLFTASGFYRLAGNRKNIAKPITPEARESFYRAFGVHHVQQVMLEKMYRDHSIGPLGINHTHTNSLQLPHLNHDYVFQT